MQESISTPLPFLVELHSFSATKLPKEGRFLRSACDPSVHVKFGNESFESEQLRKEDNPVWKLRRKFVYTIVNASQFEEHLHIEVFNGREPVGFIRVPLYQIFTGASQYDLPLTDRSGNTFANGQMARIQFSVNTNLILFPSFSFTSLSFTNLPPASPSSSCPICQPTNPYIEATLSPSGIGSSHEGITGVTGESFDLSSCTNPSSPLFSSVAYHTTSPSFSSSDFPSPLSFAPPSSPSPPSSPDYPAPTFALISPLQKGNSRKGGTFLSDMLSLSLKISVKNCVCWCPHKGMEGGVVGEEEEWKGEGELLGECWVNLWEHLGGGEEERGEVEEGSFYFQKSLSPCGEIEGQIKVLDEDFSNLYCQLASGYTNENGIFEAQQLWLGAPPPRPSLSIRYSLPPVFPSPPFITSRRRTPLLEQSVSMEEQDTLHSIEGTVSSFVSDIGLDKVAKVLPEIKKMEPYEMAEPDFVALLCYSLVTDYKTLGEGMVKKTMIAVTKIWGLLRVCSAYPPIASKFCSHHLAVGKLIEMFRYKIEGNSILAPCLGTMANLMCVSSRVQQEFVTIFSTIVNVFKNRSKRRNSEVEWEAARALYGLSSGICGGSLAPGGISGKLPLSFSSIVGELVQCCEIEDSQPSAAPEHQNSFLGVSIISSPSPFSNTTSSLNSSLNSSISMSSSPFVLCLRKIALEDLKSFCEFLSKMLASPHEKLKKFAKQIFFEQMSLPRRKRYLKNQDLVEIFQHSDREIQAAFQDFLASYSPPNPPPPPHAPSPLPSTVVSSSFSSPLSSSSSSLPSFSTPEQEAFVEGLRGSAGLDSLVMTLMDSNSEEPSMILMTYKILKGLVGYGGARYLMENLSLMEALKQMAVVEGGTYQAKSAEMLLLISQQITEARGVNVFSAPWLASICVSNFPSIETKSYQIARESIRLYPFEGKILLKELTFYNQMMARLEENDANLDIQMAIISLLTQLFASNNKSKVRPEFFDPKTRSKLISTLRKLCLKNPSGDVADLIFSINPSEPLTPTDFETFKQTLLTCNNESTEKNILNFFEKAGIKGKLCHSKYKNARVDTTPCPFYCKTCIWMICEACAELCHKDHLVEPAPPGKQPVVVMGKCKCGSTAVHQFCRAQEFELPKKKDENDAPAAPKKIPKEKRCRKCQNARKESMFYPCGHMCYCEACADNLAKSGGVCPVCSTRVKDAIKVFRS